MKKFYIQSYYQYPVTFSSIGKTIPARGAQGELRNCAEFTEREIETLKKREPFFRELQDKKKIRVLDHLPASYLPPAQRINEANDEADKLRKELKAARAKIAELEAGKGTTEESSATESEGKAGGLTDEDRQKAYEEMTYAELQDACKYAGIEYKNKKKADLIEALKAFQNQ